MASAILVSCGGDEPIDPTPAVDTKAPTITVSMNSVNIIAEPSVTISGDALKIGNDAVASWKDDVSKSCKVELSLTPAGGSVKDVHSGDKLSEEGKLQIKATDDAGNSSTAEITLTRVDTKAPEIDVKISEKNVIAGVKMTVQDNRLLFDDSVAATWTDDYSKAFAVELALTPEGGESKSVDSGVTVLDAGKLILTVADEFRNKATAEIVLKADAIYGLESLQNLSLQVDKEVNLMIGLTIADGLTLQKVEVEQDNARTQIENPNAYTPEYPGSIDIILTLARPDGSMIEVGSKDMSVKPLEYSNVSISDLAPADIVPIIGQVNWGDRNVYSYIEHLRVAEATRIVEMMWEYGAGKHSIESYQELLGELNVGMTFEYPLGYDNYEIIEGVM